MEQLILWFNISGFTLLFTSLGTAFVVYRRLKPDWLFSYLIYLAFYSFFTIFNTYVFFSQVYLISSVPVFDTIVIYITLGTALLLLIIVPRFILRLFSANLPFRGQFFIFLIAGVFLSMMVFSAVKPEWQLNRAGSFCMNGYLGGTTFYGIIRVRRLEDRARFGVVVPFLYLSCIFYFIVTIQSLILPLTVTPELDSYISLLTAGLICFLWGTITMVYMMIRNHSPENPGNAVLTENLILRFGITPREQEIIKLLLYGKSNKEIGEQLFVSIRTVEAHVYNIYRKCSVKNKLELARRLSGEA